MHTQICRSAIVLLVYLAPWPSPLKARSHLRLATAARLTSDVRQATTDPHTAGNLRVASRKLSRSPPLILSSPPQLGFTFCCFLIFVVPQLQGRQCCHIKKDLLCWPGSFVTVKRSKIATSVDVRSSYRRYRVAVRTCRAKSGTDLPPGRVIFRPLVQVGVLLLRRNGYTLIAPIRAAAKTSMALYRGHQGNGPTCRLDLQQEFGVPDVNKREVHRTSLLRCRRLVQPQSNQPKPVAFENFCNKICRLTAATRKCERAFTPAYRGLWKGLLPSVMRRQKRNACVKTFAQLVN
uniref:Secreted protein n=1 Tax=Ixodes ricinus TaxID=34613 RepID=A0A147BE27_IXORI